MALMRIFQTNSTQLARDRTKTAFVRFSAIHTTGMKSLLLISVSEDHFNKIAYYIFMTIQNFATKILHKTESSRFQ